MDKTYPKKTRKQENSLHKYFELLAESLNSAGWDMKKTLKHDVDIPWNKDMVKKFLWKPIQKAMIDEESTTKLNTVEPSAIYNVLDRHLSEKTGVHVEWPKDEEKP